VCLVALGRHIPEMQFIAVLFGDEPVVTTDVAIYQRLLKGDETGARSVLEEYIKQHAAADVHQEVLLPVLARARRDAVRGALTADESASIAAAVQRIVDELETAALAAARGRDEGEPAEATISLYVLACPARDEVDAAALRLLASRVLADGVRVDVVDPGTLVAEVLERVAATEPGVVVVASLAEPGLAHARYMLKRLRARFEEVPLVAACWEPPDDAGATCAVLLDAGATDVATTLGEARERIVQYRQVHAQPAPPRAA